MSKAFDTINIPTLIRKLLQTNIPGTIIKFIANYIKGGKAYTTYIITHPHNVNSKQAFHKVASFHQHYSTYTLQTYHHQEHQFRSWPTQMTSPSHLHPQARVQQRNTYNHTYIQFFPGQKNNLTLNPDKTTCTLFTPDPAEYKSNLDLKINNTALRMATHPKVLGLTLDRKLTYSPHIHNISLQAHTPLQIIKTLTATGWGKQKETLMATYKAVMRPALEYASSIWSLLASSTSINKLQVMQNSAWRTATGCTQDTNIQYMHDDTIIHPIHEHLQLHVSQYKQKHNIHHTPYANKPTYFNTPRLKNTTFNNGRYTTNIPTDHHTITTTDLKQTCAIYIHLLSLCI